ncbi:GIY-YIG nuclease family protein [bacterium]|nr:GIY-YIG nuclease family protein [bacterium]
MYKKRNNKEYIYYIYILANKRNGTLYIGVSNSLYRRSLEHRLKQKKDSFSAKYNTNLLVHYESYQYIQDAIEREKELKRYRRKWKLELIEKNNPHWNDLFKEME